jgi:hypothetical protein
LGKGVTAERAGPTFSWQQLVNTILSRGIRYLAYQ